MDEEESTCIFGCMFVGCQYSQSLQQFDEFLETYDIKEGDGMYLAPEDRIAMW